MKLDSNKRYLLAFSGGRDSVALFNMLSEQGHSFACVHVNHGISKNSAAWAKLCERWCEEHGVELFTLNVTVDMKSSSVEADAREKRYNAIKSVHNGFDALLTAHHRDDNVETILFNILRGGEFAAMDGIAEQSTLYGMNVVRPLLRMSRDEINEYLNRMYIYDFVDDESNKSDDYTRNFLRNTIIPQLRERFNGLDTAMEEFAEKAKVAELYRAECLESEFPDVTQIDFWDTYHKYNSGTIGRDKVISVVNRNIKKLQNIYLSRRHLEQLCSQMFKCKHGKTKYVKCFEFQKVKVRRCYNNQNQLILSFINAT